MATIKSEYYRFNGTSWDLHYFKTSMDMVDGLASALSGKLSTTGGTMTGVFTTTSNMVIGGISYINGTITSDNDMLNVAVDYINLNGGYISYLESPAHGHQAANKDYVDTKVAGLNTADIGDDDRQQYLDQTLMDLETDKLSTNTIVRSKNNLTGTSTGTGYTNTGLSVVLSGNSTYKISMRGHWERQNVGSTAWAYRQSITSSASGVYMRGMWTWYPLDNYSGPNTTLAYSDSMSTGSGATGQTVTTPSSNVAVSNAPMCFEGYIVTGSSSTTITFTHGTNVFIAPPTRSAFRGVLTATKM